MELPGATTTVSETSAALAQGLDVCCLIFPAAQNADIKARLFGSADAMAEEHGYCEGVEYTSLHVTRTGKTILGIALPISVEGAISREDTSGNTNTCATTVTAEAGGVMAEHDGIWRVVKGGVVGTDQIQLERSLDGGFKFQPVRIGTDTSYTDPLFNITLTLGAGSLTAGQTIHTWHGSAPLSDSADWTTARQHLAEKLQFFRSMLLIGDLRNDTEAGALLAQVNAYETENERFTFARASCADRLPLASMSKARVRMAGAPNVTFAEVGGTSDTVTRSTGSFSADGFLAGDTITVTGAVAGSGHNNVTGVLASVAPLVLTMGTTDFDNEGPIAGVNIVGYGTLTFAASGHTVTRNRGSWLTDGFRVGDSVTFTGTASNNVTLTITVLTATVMTFGSGLANETISMQSLTVTTGQTKAAWLAALEDEYEVIDDAPRISLVIGRARVQSSYTPWFMRRPAQWLVSAREYQHDVHISPWRKDDGSLGADVSLNDADGHLVEWDDRVDGKAATAAKFTSLRTWSNGPAGVFVARSLTRAKDASRLVDTPKLAVANLACSLVQLNSENAAIGVDLILNADGTATQESLNVIANKVNSVLKNELLTNKLNEGQRASFAKFTPNPADLYNVNDPTMTTVTELRLNGTIVKVNNKVNLSPAA